MLERIWHTSLNKISCGKQDTLGIANVNRQSFKQVKEQTVLQEKVFRRRKPCHWYSICSDKGWSKFFNKLERIPTLEQLFWFAACKGMSEPKNYLNFTVIVYIFAGMSTQNWNLWGDWMLNKCKVWEDSGRYHLSLNKI